MKAGHLTPFRGTRPSPEFIVLAAALAVRRGRHDLRLVARAAASVAVLARGTIAYEADTETVRGDPGDGGPPFGV